MFLKSFNQIKNIGQIKQYIQKNILELKPLTTIYGKNGVGKTTLSTILHSLQSGKSDLLQVKKTIGTTDEQPIYIEIDSDAGILKYENGSWNHVCPDLEIFDSYFINKNIYSGHKVDLEHEKSLPNIILGEKGITLSKAINDAKSNLSELAIQENLTLSTLKSKDAALEAIKKIDEFYNMEPYTINGIVSLNFEPEIKKLETDIKILQILNGNISQEPFEYIDFPRFNLKTFEQYLCTTLDDIAQDTEQKIKKQISDTGATIQWLERGNELLQGKDFCPFCNQPIHKLNIIKTYQNYFSKRYKDFKNELKAFDLVEASFSIMVIDNIVRAIDKNLHAKRSFKDYILEHDKWIDLDRENIIKVFEQLSRELSILKQKKIDAPLEKIEVSESTKSIFTQYYTILTQIDAYNECLKHCNDTLKGFKLSELGTKQEQLKWLKIKKLRFIDLKEFAETSIKTLIDKRDSLNKAITNNTIELKSYAEETVELYQDKINGYLADFATNFRIAINKPTFRTNQPSMGFCLIIDEHNEEPITTRTNSLESTRCLGNTLSEGDKASLALAFFMAKIQNDKNSHNKVIIIDDPISSLDTDRRDKTIYCCLKELFGHVSQIFILSHDEKFLNDIHNNGLFKKYPEKNKKTSLELKKSITGSVFEDCVLSEYTKSKFIKNYDNLKAFNSHETNFMILKGVISSLRDYIEGLLQNLYPDTFKVGPYGTLGSYINTIRQHPEHKLYKHHSTLDEINDFVTRHEHAGPSDLPSATTIKTHVDKALNFINKL